MTSLTEEPFSEDDLVEDEVSEYYLIENI